MPTQRPPLAARPTDPVAQARGLIAEAMDRGASMPDMVALDLAAAWDDLDDPEVLPAVLDPDADPDIAPVELLIRTRIVLRQAIPSVTPATRAMRLARAIRHIDTALDRLDGWTDGGRG